ncbi:MAG: GxGYxYP domain-containing protein [Candidatus Baltobacteraceae bacterium]
MRVLGAAVCAAALAALPAAGRAADAGSPGGIRWPAAQALPTFPTAQRLDVVDLSGRLTDARIMFATLQGLVNRKETRVFFIQNGNEGKRAWIDQLDVPKTEIADPWKLLERYRDEIKGLVVSDPQVPATLAVATTLAGLNDDIVVSPRLVPALTDSYHFPILADLRGRFHSDLDAETWAVDNLWPRTTHRMLVGVAPNDWAARDYPVANRAFVLWPHVGDSAESRLVDRLLRGMPTNAPYLGWFPQTRGSGEVEGVTFLSRHGDYNVATDLFVNLTAFSGVPAAGLDHVIAAPAPPLTNQIYVTLTMSDGDNVQYDQHRMRVAWDDPARGKAPLNWTINPLLADAAPAMFAYYRRTASVNDDLVAGPSGAGYAFVSMFPTDPFRAFAAQTGRYFKRTGMRVAEIHDMVRGVATAAPPQKAGIFMDEAHPLGVESYIRGVRPGPMLVGGVLPTMVKRDVHTVEQAQALLAGLRSEWDGRAPAFVSLYFDGWKMGPKDAAALTGLLGPEYHVVTADQIFALAREAGAFGRI